MYWEIIWKFIAATGEGIWGQSLRNFFARRALQTVGKHRKHPLSICCFDFSLRRKSSRSQATCHATFLLTIRQSNRHLQPSKGFSVTDTPRHGVIYFVRQCIFLAHAGYIRAYLHGMQPGLLGRRVESPIAFPFV